MSNEEYEELNTIFINSCGINFAKNEKLKSLHIFSREINMSVREAVFLFVNIEHTYNIKIPDEIIQENFFCTFNDIANVIEMLI